MMIDKNEAGLPLLRPKNIWDKGDLSISYDEFVERSMCFYKRLRHMSPAEYQKRQAEYQQLCMQNPKHARRFENEYRNNK